MSRAKLIAEPWDVGQVDSYDLGGFPPGWREWNGKYRDCMRDFWRSHQVGIGEFATRLCGSVDLYGRTRRRPTASVNLVTVHDGFTLRDLVSYDGKHNEANGEANRDGTDDNRSWNCGAEGPIDDPAMLTLRARQSRALADHAAALLRRSHAARWRRDRPDAARATTMRTARTTRSPGSTGPRRTRICLRLHPADWSPSAPPIRSSAVVDSWLAPRQSELQWFTPAGSADDRRRLVRSARSAPLPCTSMDPTIRIGRPTARSMVDDDFLVLVNAWWEQLPFTIPPTRPASPGRSRSTAMTPPRRHCRRGRPIDGRTPIDRGASRPQLVILGFAGLGHSLSRSSAR